MTVTLRAWSLDVRSTSLGSLLVTVICCLVATAPAKAADSIHSTSTALPDATRRVQTLVDELRVRLHLPAAVMAAIVPENPLLVSVAPPLEGEGTYRLSF